MPVFFLGVGVQVSAIALFAGVPVPFLPRLIDLKVIEVGTVLTHPHRPLSETTNNASKTRRGCVNLSVAITTSPVFCSHDQAELEHFQVRRRRKSDAEVRAASSGCPRAGFID